ncbi:MAG: hypothetical protein IT462_15795 [Planctomycetes bacterium]|nr:hypothetical protein [Planctomycetota bacterium]
MLARLSTAAIFVLTMTLLGACASAGGGTTQPTDTGDPEQQEKLALDKIGSVRVFYYVKGGTIGGGSGHSGVPTATQKEIRTTLINKGHAMYEGMPDNQLKEEEYYLWSVDMHDLLVVLRDQVKFFESPGAVNIGEKDPIARATNDPSVDRMIAVEVMREGKVACSYLARNWVAGGAVLDSDQKARYKKYNEAQEFILRCIRNALPRGTARPGEGGNVFPGRGR